MKRNEDKSEKLKSSFRRARQILRARRQAIADEAGVSLEIVDHAFLLRSEPSQVDFSAGEVSSVPEDLGSWKQRHALLRELAEHLKAAETILDDAFLPPGDELFVQAVLHFLPQDAPFEEWAAGLTELRSIAERAAAIPGTAGRSTLPDWEIRVARYMKSRKCSRKQYLTVAKALDACGAESAWDPRRDRRKLLGTWIEAMSSDPPDDRG